VEIETKVHDLDRAAVLGDLVRSADVAAVWERLDLDRRRAVVDCLMVVHLLAPGRGRREFDPATVRIEWRGVA